eukprot:m.106663 g.106663  ORF g.106663 m.106663 type:complete len:416 (-) comp8952_c0_seq4:1725-2972(-)
MRAAVLTLLALVGLSHATYMNTSYVVAWVLNNSHYDPTSRPNLESGSPVNILAQFRLNHLYNVDNVANTFQADVFTRLHWDDSRLAYNCSWRPSVRFPRAKIWRPDIAFYNGITVSTTADVIETSCNGSVFWGRQQLLTLGASLDLHDFPFDSQILTIALVSFALDANALMISPFQGQGIFPDPRADFSSPIWDMEKITTLNGAMALRESDPNPYGFMNLNFYLSRRFDTYIIKYMLLLGLLVLISALSYAIDAGSAPARVACSFILVVALSAFNIYVSNDLPKLSYTTFMDQYVIICFSFALVSVFEYATVNYFITQSDKSVAAIGRQMDRFFLFTAAPMWGLILLLFLLYSAGTLTAMIVLWLVWLAVGFREVVRAIYRRAEELYKTLHDQGQQTAESIPLQPVMSHPAAPAK